MEQYNTKTKQMKYASLLKHLPIIKFNNKFYKAASNLLQLYKFSLIHKCHICINERTTKGW